jgi:dTDP-4-amino-4,6-dideoxy-D-galactose acyltransferase
MDAACRLLEWDSAFFGRRIARLDRGRLTAAEAAATLEWCRGQRVDCLYFLADADDGPTVAAAEAHGFRLVDVRLTLERPGGMVPPAEPDVRPWADADLPGLRALAAVSHADTRFYFDPGFAREKCAALYATWIDKSCHGYADQVLTAGPPGEPLGYVTCHLGKDGEGQIGLIGVAAAAQGQGLGGRLVRAAVRWLHDHGMVRVAVVTQGRNGRAQRLYQRCGFVTRSLQLWYHCWPGELSQGRAAA